MASSITKVQTADALRSEYGDTVTRTQLVEWVEKTGNEFPHWLANNKQFRAGRGAYRIPQAIEIDNAVANPAPLSVMQACGVSESVRTLESGVESYVPEAMENYVAFGNHADIRKIVESGVFFPTFITGLSGCGKTSTVIQVCAELERELFRVNITPETEEDDLIGGFRLVNGETVWVYGPVIEAMKRGAVLLLDEVDLASPRIMCLQPVLEGKAIYIKKINETVKPAPGFTVFATANTKGQGDDTGKFIGANVMNEAMLDRFSATLEQEYPPAKTEERILIKAMTSLAVSDDQFAERLVTWANAIRSAYVEGAIDEIITTRRLVDTVRSFSIWKDRAKAIDLVIARFNTDTRLAMKSLYEKVDDTIREGKVTEQAAKVTTVEIDDNEVPF